ncbi:MAG: MFS transporter [Dehalococcoidia bacterium]
MSITPRKRIRHPRDVFYGWWIVASGFLVQLLNGSLLFHSFTAYFVFLQAEFGWSRTVLAGAFSMTRVESGLLGPIEGWLIDRFGPRAVMRVGIVLFGSGFILLSRIDSIVGFYLAFAILAFGSALSGFLPVSAAVANWFARRRATAMGIMMTGMGFGGLLVPIVTWSLTSFGWRETAFGSGILVLAVGLPAVQLMRHHPEQYGYLPDGEPMTPEQAEQPREAFTGLTARQALRTSSFWFLSLGHSVALLIVGAAMVHQIPHMVEGVGLSIQTAGIVVAFLMAMVIIGQLAGGPIGDRFEKRYVVAGCMLGHSIALVIFALATNLIAVVAFALLHGLAWGIRGPLLNSIRADYFGRTAFATIMGFSSLIIMGGMTIGPLFAGAMADWLGDYRISFIVLAVATALGSLLFLMARPPVLPEPSGPEMPESTLDRVTAKADEETVPSRAR